MSRTHTITVRVEVDDEEIDAVAIAEDIESSFMSWADRGELVYEVESIEVNPEQDRWAF